MLGKDLTEDEVHGEDEVMQDGDCGEEETEGPGRVVRQLGSVNIGGGRRGAGKQDDVVMPDVKAGDES